MNKQTAHYHLPGLFEFYELYRMFLPLFREHREYFYDWCDIGSIYGAPPDCIWGGGRVSLEDHDAGEVLALLQEYGISARLTFSNSLLCEEHQSVIFCGQFIHAILFCSLLLRLLSFDFSLRIFLAQAGQYLDAPEPGTYSTPHTVQFLAGIAAHRFVGMICNSSTKPMNL